MPPLPYYILLALQCFRVLERAGLEVNISISSRGKEMTARLTVNNADKVSILDFAADGLDVRCPNARLEFVWADWFNTIDGWIPFSELPLRFVSLPSCCPACAKPMPAIRPDIDAWQAFLRRPSPPKPWPMSGACTPQADDQLINMRELAGCLPFHVADAGGSPE